VLYCAAERQFERIDLEGLRDEVVGPGPDRANGGVEAPEGRDDDDGYVRAVGDDPAAELESAHAPHREVGDDRVEVLAGEERKRVIGGGARVGDETSTAEASLDELAHAPLVVDHQDPAAHGDASPFGRWTENVLPWPTWLRAAIHPP